MSSNKKEYIEAHSSSCLQARITRAKKEKLLIAQCQKGETEKENDITIFGSTGNAYTVKIENQTCPTCTCPDFKNQLNKIQQAQIGYQNELLLPICKHILFVFLRVLKFDSEEILNLHKITFNKDYIPNHFIQLRIQDTKEVHASKDAIDAWTKLNESKTNFRKPIEGDCSICCEEFLPSSENDLEWCKTQCGNNFHRICIEGLKKFYQEKNQPILCPLCRIEWTNIEEPLHQNIHHKRKREQYKINEEEGYLNFRHHTKQREKREYKKKTLIN
jgi:hypothetical protein